MSNIAADSGSGMSDDRCANDKIGEYVQEWPAGPHHPTRGPSAASRLVRQCRGRERVSGRVRAGTNANPANWPRSDDWPGPNVGTGREVAPSGTSCTRGERHG